MEGLKFGLTEYGIWLLFGGLFMVLLLQTITLHKIKKTVRLLKQMEAKEKYIEKPDTKELGFEEIQQAEQEKTAEIPKTTLENQQVEESPEQLIDAVLAEVFR